MPKPTKAELTKYKKLLLHQLAILHGDVGSMREEALKACEQDSSVDHLADQGTDNYDQGFMLGLIENEEETIALIEEALLRIEGKGEWPFGRCPACDEEIAEAKASGQKAARGRGKAARPDPWIPKERLAYIPWARYCVRHQAEEENSRESA
ncbi:MAG: hypothetical protein Fur0037_27800 [Planctomycetota bacterium]